MTLATISRYSFINCRLFRFLVFLFFAPLYNAFLINYHFNKATEVEQCSLQIINLIYSLLIFRFCIAPCHYFSFHEKFTNGRHCFSVTDLLVYYSMDPHVTLSLIYVCLAEWLKNRGPFTGLLSQFPTRRIKFHFRSTCFKEWLYEGFIFHGCETVRVPCICGDHRES